MIENFVPYEESLALKKLGFDELCFGYYYHENSFTRCHPQIYYSDTFTECNPHEKIPLDSCKSPLYQQAFKFFREKYNFFGYMDFHNANFWYFRIDHVSANDMIYHSVDDNLKFTTYEEAELECIRKMIKIARYLKL